MILDSGLTNCVTQYSSGLTSTLSIEPEAPRIAAPHRPRDIGRNLLVGAWSTAASGGGLRACAGTGREQREHLREGMTTAIGHAWLTISGSHR